MKYVRLYCDYAYVVTEKTGNERHVHAALWLKEELRTDHMKIRWARMFKELDNDEQRILKNGIKVMYNDDWYKTYLQKEDETEIVYCNPPDKYLNYPQRQPTDVVKAPRSIYRHYEELWQKYRNTASPSDPRACADFLFELMYSKRVLPVLPNDRDWETVLRYFCHNSS